METKDAREIIHHIRKIATIILFLLLSICCVRVVIADDATAEPVQGVVFSIRDENGQIETVETSLGELEMKCLLDNNNVVMEDNQGRPNIVFGSIIIGAEDAVNIGEDLKVYTEWDATSTSKITLVQDKQNDKWFGTNGRLFIRNSSERVVLNGQTIKVIGGADNPVNIAGKAFSDTTVIIKDGEPIEIMPDFMDNQGK